MVHCAVNDTFAMHYVGEVFGFPKQGKDGYGLGFAHVRKLPFLARAVHSLIAGVRLICPNRKVEEPAK